MKKRTRSAYQQFFAATLLIGGALQLALPALADGTLAGTSISNTANATYEDPAIPGTTIDTTSNVVTVTISEVAGVTVTAAGVTDINGAQVQVGDVLNYTYTVTNVGNDPTQFRVPNLAKVTGPASVTGNLEISYDGGATFVPITGTEAISTSIPVGGSIIVRVPVTVAAGAQANDVITVTLGDTPGDAQNLLRNPNGGDLYTVDNPDTAGAPEVPGAPVNGVREASVTQQVAVASTLKTYTLAALLKVRSAYDNAGTPVITDDKLSYGLSLRVESTDPTGKGITPAPLAGTTINLNGAPVSRILVSDAIPTGTELSVAPTPPPGWQAVYTTDAVTVDANAANWKAFPLQGADTLAGITRVGFVNNPAVVTSVAPGTTLNGFSIDLKVKASAASPLAVANIAQLFGQTPGTNAPVYDESGDQSPSNFNPDGTPLLGTDTNGDGIPDAITPAIVDDGFINNPSVPETGTDPGNNNTGNTNPGNAPGTEVGGESNTFTISAPVASAVQNGPSGAPDAIGPTSNNDDFTNKTSLVPPNLTAGTGKTLDPSPVAFTNTVKNSGTDAGVLTLQPTAPATLTDLPNGTTVTITYGSDSVAYTYNSTTGIFTVLSSTTGGQPIKVLNFTPGTSVNYGVEVNLPNLTPLSTDVNRGFPVPVVASIDNYLTDTNSDGIKDSGNDNVVDATNTTIDRVYTGFLKMVKESRVLAGTGPAVQGADGTFSSTDKKPAPGNILEYRITYTNISEAQAGTGNLILNAGKVVIVEDGTLSTVLGDNKNNWAIDNDGNGQIDTSNITGSAIDSGASTITFFSGKPATASGADQTGTTVTTDVTKYVNTVTGVVAPGQSRTFGFKRKVN
ncbi:beta strand repeat-containing protein [Phormidesmis sp. 146-33]